MKQFCLGVIVATGLTLPALALDGTRSPSNVAPPVLVPSVQLRRDAAELLERAAQLRRTAADLLAQANPGGASLRGQLVGAWALVSCDGGAFPFTAALCTNPNGIHILDASGHYTTVHAARGRAKLTDITRPGTAEEYKAIAVDFRANFGTWSVNEADKTITYHFDGAFAPNVEGTDAKGNVSISGDELKIGSVVWRRIKQ